VREENVNEYGPLRGISVPGRGAAVSVPEWLRRSVRWYADKEAVIDGARRFTYQQFNERVNRQANGLSARGIAKGERVAVVLRNSVEAMESFGAAAKAGFVHVPINFRLSRREVGDILQHSGSRFFIVHREFASLLDLAAECPDLEQVIVVDDGESGSDYERWLAEQSAQEPTADIVAEDNFFIVYTSGTTGAAKGAFYQHRQPAAHAPVPVLGYDMRHDSRILLVYPHNSIASLNVVYVPAWMLGATVVLTDVRQFSAERWLDTVVREKVTHCHLVPTMLFRVLEHPKVREVDLSSLQTIGYGSAPMPQERIERLHEVFGSVLMQAYGMTEVSSITTIFSKQDHVEALKGNPERLRACGRPAFGCELRVVTDEGREVKPGEIGEIVFRGPILMSGYWNDPERTAETIRDGWLHSGDLATVDADGFIYIVDRKKDLIISGGANIASSEVENVIYWHEAVREAAVVGRPDDEWGERVHAFVSLHEGKSMASEELIAFCRERLAHYKCPSRIDILPDLPKNALGKILKSDMRATLWRGRSRAVN
jgi:acyl-CoA synthetase (AMP-forming)/AMP-acid ligase II